MLNRLFIISLFLFSLNIISCSKALTQTKKAVLVMDYIDEKDEYTVVSLIYGNNEKKAKARALKRAAELSKENGYMYFMVIEETRVAVIPGKDGWPSAYDFPQNLYEEEIVQKGYDRERFIEGSKIDNESYPAIQLKIKAAAKPRARSYKVCSLIECN